MVAGYFSSSPSELTQSSTEKISSFFLIAWVLGFLLGPIYFYQSGYPQPGNIILALGAIPAFLLFIKTTGARLPAFFSTGLLFVSLTVAINLIYFAFYRDSWFFLSSVYYLYNFLVFLFVLYMFRAAPLLMNRLTYFLVALCIIGEFLWIAFFPDMRMRETGTFNNPNQLAGWGLLMACMLLCLKRGSSISFFDIILLALVGYIESQALSKAGIITYTLLLGLVVFTPLLGKITRLVTTMLIFGALLLDVSGITRLQSWGGLDRVIDRIQNIGEEHDDSAQGRGYDRILTYPENLIYGAGEGYFERFGEDFELHSGLGTILFSYGAFGFAVFIVFLFCIFRLLPWYYTLLLAPVLLFGIPHQNIRFTPTWIFLAIACAHIYMPVLQEKLYSADDDRGVGAAKTE